jgi:hypothetical protein
MTQGEEGGLTGIREGIEGDEFGEMEVGGEDGRTSSPLLGRTRPLHAYRISNK